MSYVFKRLSEVEALTNVPEGAKVLAEVNGEIRRVPAAKGESGSAGGEQTFDITFTDIVYDGTPYVKADKTKEEVAQAIKEGKRINAKRSYTDGYSQLTPSIFFEVDYNVEFYYIYSYHVSQTVLKLGIDIISFSDGFYDGSGYICPIGRFIINSIATS